MGNFCTRKGPSVPESTMEAKKGPDASISSTSTAITPATNAAAKPSSLFSSIQTLFSSIISGQPKVQSHEQKGSDEKMTSSVYFGGEFQMTSPSTVDDNGAGTGLYNSNFNINSNSNGGGGGGGANIKSNRNADAVNNNNNNNSNDAINKKDANNPYAGMTSQEKAKARWGIVRRVFMTMFRDAEYSKLTSTQHIYIKKLLRERQNLLAIPQIDSIKSIKGKLKRPLALGGGGGGGGGGGVESIGKGLTRTFSNIFTPKAGGPGAKKKTESFWNIALFQTEARKNLEEARRKKKEKEEHSLRLGLFRSIARNMPAPPPRNPVTDYAVFDGLWLITDLNMANLNEEPDQTVVNAVASLLITEVKIDADRARSFSLTCANRNWPTDLRFSSHVFQGSAVYVPKPTLQARDTVIEATVRKCRGRYIGTVKEKGSKGLGGKMMTYDVIMVRNQDNKKVAAMREKEGFIVLILRALGSNYRILDECKDVALRLAGMDFGDLPSPNDEPTARPMNSFMQRPKTMISPANKDGGMLPIESDWETERKKSKMAEEGRRKLQELFTPTGNNPIPTLQQ